MRHATALLSFLVLAWPAAAQVRGPQEVTVQVGKLAGVSLTIDGDEAEYAVLGGDAFGGFREFSDPKVFRFQVLGYAPGVGHIVVGTTKGGKLQPLFTVKVVVTGAPLPPPVPPPPVPPDPPAPADPLVKTLKDAAKADGWAMTKLADLGLGLRQCAALTLGGRTGAELQRIHIDALQKALPGGVPNAVYAVCSGKLKALDAILPPSQPDKVPSDAEREQVKAVYLELATACERASK